MKTTYAILIWVAIVQGGDPQWSAFAEVKTGPFHPGIRNFLEVYSDSRPMSTVKIGLGSSGGFLVGRYSYSLFRGTSQIRGIAVNGDAVWEERIAAAGIRSYQKPLYLELLYLKGSVKETISTRDPVIETLTATYYDPDVRGYAIVAGFILPLISIVKLNIEGEYIRLPVYRDPVQKHDQVNIGGFHVSAGITVQL
ncbi:MAG: hypothetical protein ACE5D1_02305 [Fidelibacterota bacterium]